MKAMKLEKNLVGVAGECLVAAELTLRGFIAAITLRNTRGTDIIASTSDGDQSVSIQVKSNSSGKPSWMLGKSSETFFSKNHIYVFVAIGDLLTRPAFYIVPSTVVAKQIAQSHQRWLAGAKKDGTPRKDSNMRQFKDPGSEYLERWDLLFDP